MEPAKVLSERPCEGPATLLNQLRWILSGLQMGGIKDWPTRSSTVSTEVLAVSPASVPESELADLLGPDPPFAEDIESPSPSDLDEPPALFFKPEPGPAVPVEVKDPLQALLDIREELGDCKRCRLHSSRTHLVFADGSPHARLVFVGEAPGFDEDKQGLPFVGKAGKLLDKMIRSIGFLREEVYICNVLKCRPPNNRTPNADEIEICSPFLTQQLQALHPHVICALGASAAQTLLATSSAISRLRGTIHRWRGIPLVCTYHPAYLLRTPAQKAATWQDLLMVSRLLQTEKDDLSR